MKQTQRKRRKWEKAEARAIKGEFKDHDTSASKDEEDDDIKKWSIRKEKQAYYIECSRKLMMRKT